MAVLDVFQKRELSGIAGAQDAGKDLGADFGQAGPWNARGRVGRELASCWCCWTLALTEGPSPNKVPDSN